MAQTDPYDGQTHKSAALHHCGHSKDVDGARGVAETPGVVGTRVLRFVLLVTARTSPVLERVRRAAVPEGSAPLLVVHDARGVLRGSYAVDPATGLVWTYVHPACTFAALDESLGVLAGALSDDAPAAAAGYAPPGALDWRITVARGVSADPHRGPERVPHSGLMLGALAPRLSIHCCTIAAPDAPPSEIRVLQVYMGTRRTVARAQHRGRTTAAARDWARVPWIPMARALAQRWISAHASSLVSGGPDPPSAAPPPLIHDPADPTPLINDPADPTPLINNPVALTPLVEDPADPTPLVEDPVAPTSAALIGDAADARSGGCDTTRCDADRDTQPNDRAAGGDTHPPATSDCGDDGRYTVHVVIVPFAELPTDAVPARPGAAPLGPAEPSREWHWDDAVHDRRAHAAAEELIRQERAERRTAPSASGPGGTPRRSRSEPLAGARRCRPAFVGCRGLDLSRIALEAAPPPAPATYRAAHPPTPGPFVEPSCAVCDDRAPAVTLLPCAHRCLCDVCVSAMQRMGGLLRCPLCRRPVSDLDLDAQPCM